MKNISVLIISVLLVFSMDVNAGESVTEYKLTKCPDSPNCVCSLDEREQHAIKPIAFGGIDAGISRELMLKVIKDLPRTNTLINEKNYLKVTFTSLVFRFVDDVEFLWDESQGVIQVRSASRVGYSDLGANRRRVEDIRQRYKDKLQQLLRSGA